MASVTHADIVRLFPTMQDHTVLEIPMGNGQPEFPPANPIEVPPEQPPPDIPPGGPVEEPVPPPELPPETPIEVPPSPEEVSACFD